MRRTIALLCLSAACAAQATAPAKPPANDLPANDLPADCAKAETQRQLNACAAADFEKAQADYAGVYAELSKGLAPAQRTLLRTAQKQWLAYRTAACDFDAAGVRGGSAEGMVRLQCQTRRTLDRTEELRRHLSCPEGDVSCVRPTTR